MSLAQPLSPRLARLRARFVAHRPATHDDASLIWAAVAVVLAPSPDAVLLIRRADREGDPWSGHMALPGGRREPEDRDLGATAAREAREELGLVLTADELIGTLDDVVPRTPVLPPIAVRPCVFCLPQRPLLRPNLEVAAYQWTELDHLLHPETYRTAELEVRGERRAFPAYHIDETPVWGMTERILTDLFRHLQD